MRRLFNSGLSVDRLSNADIKYIIFGDQNINSPGNFMIYEEKMAKQEICHIEFTLGMRPPGYVDVGVVRQFSVYIALYCHLSVLVLWLSG